MLHGHAFAETASSRRALQPSVEVFIGELVETEINSGLIMRLGTSTTVKLGALAKFRIDKFVVDAGGVLDLDQGALVIDRDDNAKSERLQVRSPFALIAARGTMFFAGPSKDVFGVFVGRGIVTVTGGGRTVTLQDGQGTDIVKAGSAPPVSALLRRIGMLADQHNSLPQREPLVGPMLYRLIESGTRQN